MAIKEAIKEHEDEMFMVDDEDEGAQDNKYLTFNLANEIYGIDIGDITEIIEVQKVTEVPDMPLYVRGVINLRGQVIPIMDLRIRFNMEERAYDDRTCIIIVDVRNTSIGFIVDTVLEVVNIPEADIDPPPQFKTASGHEKYISGIGKIGENVKILLDVQRIIHREDFNMINQKIEKQNN